MFWDNILGQYVGTIFWANILGQYVSFPFWEGCHAGLFFFICACAYVHVHADADAHAHVHRRLLFGTLPSKDDETALPSKDDETAYGRGKPVPGKDPLDVLDDISTDVNGEGQGDGAGLTDWQKCACI